MKQGQRGVVCVRASARMVKEGFNCHTPFHRSPHLLSEEEKAALSGTILDEDISGPGTGSVEEGVGQKGSRAFRRLPFFEGHPEGLVCLRSSSRTLPSADSIDGTNAKKPPFIVGYASNEWVRFRSFALFLITTTESVSSHSNLNLELILSSSNVLNAEVRQYVVKDCPWQYPATPGLTATQNSLRLPTSPIPFRILRHPFGTFLPGKPTQSDRRTRQTSLNPRCSSHASHDALRSADLHCQWRALPARARVRPALALALAPGARLCHLAAQRSRFPFGFACVPLFATFFAP